MKTNEKLLLDDLISQVLYFNEQDAAFGGVLKITSRGVSLSTHNNIWGMGTAWASSEKDLKEMTAWVKDQYRRFSSGQKVNKFGLYLEHYEESRDLENDIKRGIK
jgi:GH43 family beta-xylosidase